MELSFHAVQILERLRNDIQTKGQRSLDDIRFRQHKIAQSEKREVTEKDFIAATAGDAVIAEEEACALFRELAGGGERMPFAEVLRALRCPTSRQRVVLVRAVFDMIDQDRDGLLSHDQVIACYRAANHPDVRRGLRTSAEVREDFIQTLRDMDRGRLLTFPAFLDFYCSLMAFTSEECFRETIGTVWVPPVVMGNEQAFASKIIGCAGGLAENLRAQILGRGMKGVSTFHRGIREAAERGGIGEISQEAFCASAGYAGAKLTVCEMAEVCRYLDRHGTGMIHPVDALRVVLGKLSEHRKAKIDDTFDFLLLEAGAPVDSTLDSTAVMIRFRAEAHPDVVSGTKTPQEVLADLMEAFEDARLTGGRVTRLAWHEHHWDISALIDDDNAFCRYLERVWGTRINDSTEYRSVKPPKGNERLIRTSMSLPCDSTSWSDSPERVDPAASARGTKDVLKMTPGPIQLYKEGNRQGQDASHAPREAWADRPMIKHEQVVVEQERRSARDAEACPSIPPGILAILDRARGNLSARGVRGVSLLLKALRKEDRTGKGTIKLSGFKTAAVSAGLGLKEKEMRILFECLDCAADGEIPYERFLQNLREPLPPHRLALVNQAFDRLDADRDGLALVEDITKAFRASAHPQVLEGCRDEEEVQQEFLETFAVWDGARGLCTRDDFIRWMELISLSLPTAADSTFERLVRGCWGMPKTTTDRDKAEKRCPLRVVVTRADGSTSVEEIVSGLGLTSGDGSCRGFENSSRSGTISRTQAEDIRQELAARGVHAVHVQLLQQGDIAENPKTTEEESCPLQPGRYRYSPQDVTMAKLGPAADRNARDSPRGQRSIQAEGFNLNRGLQSVLDAIHERLASRGPAGFFTLSRLLRSSGFSRSQPDLLSDRPCTALPPSALKAERNGAFVSLSSFKDILSEMGCGLNSKDMTQIFLQLDQQGQGHGEIPIEVALEAIRGRLTGVRLALVRAAFSRLNGGGYSQGNVAAAASDVIAHFDPQGHPEVVAARRSPEDVRKEFMDAMTAMDGLVGWKDFENYYADVSAATPSDAYFILLVQGCWGLGATAVAKAVTTTAPTNTRESVARRNNIAGRRMYPPTKTTGILGGTAHPANVMTSRFKSAGQHKRVPTAGVAAILRKLGVEIQSQGTSWGLAGLRRALFHADGNRDGFLSFGEFKAALTSIQMEMAPGEMRALFGFLEAEESVGVGRGCTCGITSCQALVDAIRPPLSGERLGLVQLAFRKMDLRGEGRVSPETVAQRFAASKHPAVLKGHASVEEKHQELLDTFFSIDTNDGQISREDFIEHHSDLSFSIPSDEEFRQLVLKCWDIDSDKGHATDRTPLDEITIEDKSVKQACRKGTHWRNFSVTYLDGSKGIEELPFPSERREDSEAPLTAAEETALKHFLFKRDKTHAAELTLLPKGVQCQRHSTDSLPLSAEDPAVEIRSAWAWAPMSLSEIHTADKTAVAVGSGNLIRSTVYGRDDAGECDRGNERHVRSSLQTSTEGNVERQKINGPIGDVMHNSPDGREETCAKLKNQWKVEADMDKDQEAHPSVRYLLSMVRSELNVRGVTCMASLCRRLREATTAVIFSGRRAKVVKEVDFLRALRETISLLTESDIRYIFSYFEMRDSGIMDPEAFINCLYGCMSKKRKKLVLRVFDKLDTTGTGHVKLDQVLDAFHATKHPDAISGCRSPDVIFKDFVESFIEGLPSEKRTNLREGGRVTREDFCRYYDIVSATIPDDGHFELLLNSCWCMPTPVGINEIAQDHGLDERGVTPCAESEGIDDTLRGYRKSEASFRQSQGEMGSHVDNVPVTLSPKKTRDRSGKTQATEGSPRGHSRIRRYGDMNKLRAAHLARTFDTQIIFGQAVDDRETRRYRRAQSAIPLDDGKTPLAAGGGRRRPMADGAAWTSGGRRIIPGSMVFMSHLDNGMAVADRLIDQKSPLSDGVIAPLDGDTRRWLNAERKSQAAAASREPPVWIPKEGRKTVKITSLSDTLANEADPSDPLSLTKDIPNDVKSSGNMLDQQGSSVPRAPSPMKRESEDYTPRPHLCEEDWSTIKAEREGVRDQAGGVHLSGSGDDSIQKGWHQQVAPRPRDPPSDTYRSSLVFG